MSDQESGAVQVVAEPLGLTRLQALATDGFGDFVKGVVDIERRIMAVGGDLHSDGETALLESGSRQLDLWGINLFPARFGAEDWIEFDSLINIRPSRGNRSRGVENPQVRRSALRIIAELVDRDA